MFEGEALVFGRRTHVRSHPSLSDMARIRHATIEDAEKISKVHVATWHSAYAGMISQSALDLHNVPARTARWREILKSTAWPVFVVEASGEVVGFSSCVFCRDRDIGAEEACELTALYLLEHVSREGIGTALLHCCGAEALNRNCNTMSLWVLKDNVRARAFYASLGFELDGTMKHDLRLEADEVRMRARLPFAANA